MDREAARGHDGFLERVAAMLREEGFTGRPDADVPVVHFHHPDKLQELLRLDLGPAVADEEALLAAARAVVRHSVRTGHPHFHNQLFAAADPFGVAGAWITEALNTSQYTFEVAPSLMLVEHKVIQRALALVGFDGGDGIFTPGGSVSNMYGIVAARYQAFPQVKTEGMRALPPLAVFTSDDSHYSMTKGAHWLGLGTNAVVKVATGPDGRMLPDALRDAIAGARLAGVHPVMVNATVGTTVLGAVDPLGAIADVCEEAGVWLHVDACWGGSLLLSAKHRGALLGLARADSASWNPHKMLGAPLQCSVFMVRHGGGLLHRCNAAAAAYLFQQDKFYDVSWDTGDKSVQCGRKVDALKLWLMWKARGDAGLATLVEHAMESASYFRSRVRDAEGFRLVTDVQDCTNTCFWYIPARLRGRTEDEAWWQEVAKVAPAIKERLVLDGSLLVGYCPLPHKGLVNFFRMVVTCQPPARRQDMDFVLQEIRRHGEAV